MPPASLALYQEGGAALLGQFSFGTVPAATASAALTFEVWNTKGDPTADTATGVLIPPFESAPGANDWNQRGRSTTERWYEFRLVGVIGDAAPQVTGWTPAGTARPFHMNPIPANSARVVELRWAVPAGAPDLDLDHLLAVEWDRPAVPLGAGLEEAGIRGVCTRTGDGLATYLVEGGELTASGSPDADVHVADLSWYYAGVPRQLLAHTITTDGAAADGALADGQAYWLALSAGAGPGLTETRGNKGIAPLSPATRPDLPEGEELVGYVHVEFSGIVESADLYQEDRRYGRMALYGTGLDRKVGTGQAIAGGYLVTYDTPRPVVFPADTDPLRLWLLPSTGNLSTAAERPDPHALALGVGASDGSTLTAWAAQHPLVGPRLVVARLSFAAEVAEGQEAYAVLEAEGAGYLRLPAPVTVAVRSIGTATDGRLAWDIHGWDPAAEAWVSLFPSSGTVDRRPAIEAGATALLSSAARPEELRIFPLYRATIIEVPTGGTLPAGAELILTAEVCSA